MNMAITNAAPPRDTWSSEAARIAAINAVLGERRLAGSALARTGKSAQDFGADGALTSFAAIREIPEAKQ